MMTMFFPSTVQVGLPHLHSSFIPDPASTRRISAISASHRSRYAISMYAPRSTIIWYVRHAVNSTWPPLVDSVRQLQALVRPPPLLAGLTHTYGISQAAF